MAAAFLPSILVPIVGLVFPAFSMALFFIYVSIDDISFLYDLTYKSKSGQIISEQMIFNKIFQII